ncbi:MAG: hypothetical protein PUE61_12905 [Clostridiales bacterium]|nr:hypothetical protein [Clostridiales bacterium]
MKPKFKSYRALAGRRIAEEFVKDRLLLYYLILLIVGLFLSTAQLVMGAEDGVINGYSLIILLIVPPLEIFFVARARSECKGKNVRQWGIMFLVAFVIFTFITFFAITGYIGLFFAAESRVFENGALNLVLRADAETTELVSFTMTEVLATLGMLLSCLYYFFMGFSLRQLGKMLDTEEIKRGTFLPTALVILLMTAETLIENVQNIFTLTAFTPADIAGLLSVICTIASQSLIAILFLRTWREWRAQDHLNYT